MKPRIPRSRRFQPLSFALMMTVVVVASINAFQQTTTSSNDQTVQKSINQGSTERVVKVYDGDTIKLASGEKVRFIGIDTPERHDNPKLHRDVKRIGEDAEVIKKMGERAYSFTESLLADKDVRLEFDAQPRDKYGRLLAYVYLSDGTFVNEEIIKNGYAYPMTIAPNVRHANNFKALFEEARVQKRGLWAEKP